MIRFGTLLPGKLFHYFIKFRYANIAFIIDMNFDIKAFGNLCELYGRSKSGALRGFVVESTLKDYANVIII